MRRLLVLILFILMSSLVFADHYSFSKITWSKCAFLISGTVSLTTLISGLYYQKLSDDAYENYKNAQSKSYATSYRIVSDNYNSTASFYKTFSLVSGIIALTSAGLDYFIFGRVDDTISLHFKTDKPSISISKKF